MFKDSEVPSLRSLAFRKIVGQLFRCNVHRHGIKDATTFVRAYLRRAPLPAALRDSLLASCSESFTDVRRWSEKHCELFQDRKATRSQYLPLFFDALIWNPNTLTVDDSSSAESLIAANSDWPQLQFQLSCAYAMETKLKRDFDKIWIRAFKKKLNDHPLYDFWFAYLENHTNSHVYMNLFDNTTAQLTPHQLVSLAFQWAVSNGYYELATFFWRKVTPAQGEYVAMLQWRRLLRTCVHKDVYAFFCEKLCAVNGQNMIRITTPVFLHSIQYATDKDQSVTAKESYVTRIKFILTHSCESMRRGLFEAQNYRALQLCMQRRSAKLIRLLQSSVSPQKMMDAVERIGTEFPGYYYRMENSGFYGGATSGSSSGARGRGMGGLRQWSTG